MKRPSVKGNTSLSCFLVKAKQEPANDQSKSSFGFGGKLFAGQRGFDPKTIVLQIIALQLVYYFTLSLSVIVVDALTGHQRHMGQLFSNTVFDMKMDYSFVTLIAHLINILPTVVAEAYIVEKANKCLDFTLTIFIIHLCCTSFTYKFPQTFAWWFYHSVLVTITVLAAEAFCLKLETAEIKINVGDIIERGKELGKEAASKIMQHKDGRKGSKELKKSKRLDKAEEEV